MRNVRLKFETVFTTDDEETFQPRPAIVPTDATPGSPEKISEMAARVECGEELWHERDSTWLGNQKDS